MQEFKKFSEEHYNEICSLLDINPQTDIASVKFLDAKLNIENINQTVDNLFQLLENKVAFIFGAGPSLPSIILEIKSVLGDNHDNIAVIAVDGATKALQEKKIPIDVVVSDLDGSLSAIVEQQKKGSIIIVHAHGDNQEKVRRFIELITPTNVIGTCQAAETSKIRNLGGFTDGDRAAYIAANFHSKTIVLLAFDFGKIIGKYSKPDVYTKDIPITERKKIKLDFAKKLLAELPRHFPSMEILNFTPQGEEIQNIRKTTIEEIQELFEEK